jgi:hypothetical protein
MFSTQLASASNDPYGLLERIGETKAQSIEFRFRNSNRVGFSYGWLGLWRYDPSSGLLVKFSGDVIYLVLIVGNNLDVPLRLGSPSLLDGLAEHRVAWVRESPEDKAKESESRGPIIDSIQIVACDSPDAERAWIERTVPGLGSIKLVTPEP